MFCPKCGQQQVADYIRFCSRCGLAIGGLGEFIAGGAVVPAPKDARTPTTSSLKRKGVRRGAQLMFFSAVLAPLCFGLCFLVDGPGPLLIPVSVFTAGLVLMLYTQLFGEENQPGMNYSSQPANFAATSDATALPPAANLNLNSTGGQKVATAEMIRPPSVTEHTTKLLSNDEG